MLTFSLPVVNRFAFTLSADQLFAFKSVNFHLLLLHMINRLVQIEKLIDSTQEFRRIRGQTGNQPTTLRLIWQYSFDSPIDNTLQLSNVRETKAHPAREGYYLTYNVYIMYKLLIIFIIQSNDINVLEVCSSKLKEIVSPYGPTVRQQLAFGTQSDFDI